MPLLKDPDAAWRAGTLLAWGRGNFSYRTQRFRYIQYADGSEELYDHEADPHGWYNLAGRAEYATRIAGFRDQIPSDPAALHSATSPRPHNAWFREYLRKSGILD